MDKRRCYLFALEVVPLQVSEVYDELPLHCTLMHRFLSKLSPEELASHVRPFFESVQPITLVAEKLVLLGPKQIPVSELELTSELRQLHGKLYTLLSNLHVEYTAPEWVAKGYRAHVSERPNARLEVGSKQSCKAAYIIEVKVPGHDHQRFVRVKFDFRAVHK